MAERKLLSEGHGCFLSLIGVCGGITHGGAVGSTAAVNSSDGDLMVWATKGAFMVRINAL